MVAAMGWAVELSRAVSQNGYTQRACAEAAYLLAFRGGGCGHHVIAGANRRFTQLGLSLLLAARCLSYRAHHARIGLHGRSRELSDVAAACHAADPAGAARYVQRLWRDRAARAGTRIPEWLFWIAAGAGRQWRPPSAST